MKTRTSGKVFHGLVKYNKSKKRDLNSALVENSTYSRGNVKRRILEESLLAYECQICKNAGMHNNEKLVLHLDHKNGIHNDHRIENLRFLCPNCHSQQKTYAGKNKSYKKLLSYNGQYSEL